jgi:hypothetical protein
VSANGQKAHCDALAATLKVAKSVLRAASCTLIYAGLIVGGWAFAVGAFATVAAVFHHFAGRV